MQQQYQGYQQPAQPVQVIAPQSVQELKFYKSGFLRSAPGKFQADQRRMLNQGWQVKSIAFLGINFWLQRVIAVAYERIPQQQ